MTTRNNCYITEYLGKLVIGHGPDGTMTNAEAKAEIKRRNDEQSAKLADRQAKIDLALATGQMPWASTDKIFDRLARIAEQEAIENEN